MKVDGVRASPSAGTKDLKQPALRLVNRGCLPKPGGIERQFDSVIALGLANGMAVDVWTATRHPALPDGTRCHRSPIGERPMIVYALWLLLSKLWHGVRSRGRRVVTIVGGSSVEAALVLALGQRQRGRAVVYLAGGGVDGSEFASLRRPWLRRLIVRRADAIVLHTPSYAGELERAGYRGDIHLVPTLTGRRRERCSFPSVPVGASGTVRALWCGRNHPVKNLAGLSRLAKEAFPNAGVHVDVIVDRPSALNFGSAVVHVGCPNPRAHMKDADVLVLTSVHESQPNVLAEAALEGVPLVAYAVGGLPEALEELGHGSLVATDDTDEHFARVVAAVGQAYREPEARSALKARAAELYQRDAEKAWERVLTGVDATTASR